MSEKIYREIIITHTAQAHSKPSQTSRWSLLRTWLIIFAKSSILEADYIRRVAKGGEGGGGLPPARLQQVQFALNRKHAFFDAMP